MHTKRRSARINIKALVILATVTALLGVGAVVGHYVRKRMMANDALATGRAALKSQSWADACKHLRRYLKKYPDDVDVLEQYASANLAVRPRESFQIAAAIGAYRRLLRHRQGDAFVCRQLARLYYGFEDYVNAAYVSHQRLDVDPNDGDALLWLGRSLAAQHKRKEAKEVLVQLVELHPDRVRAYALMASMEIQESVATGIPVALEWLTKAVSANPKSSEALALRARFHRVISREWESARKDLEAADDLLDDDPRTHLLLADEWIAWEQFERAAHFLQRVDQTTNDVLTRYEIDIDVVAFAKFTSYANLFLSDPAATRHAAMAQRGLDELLGGYRVRFLPIAARLYFAADRIDDAETCINEYGQAIAEHSPQAQRSEAFALLQAQLAVEKKQPYSAINLLVGPGGQPPRTPEALRFLAKTLRQTGQHGRARETLLKLVDDRPQDRLAWMELAEGFRHRDWDRAFTAAGTAWRLRPTLGARLLLLEAQLMRADGKPDADARILEVHDELTTLQIQFPTNVPLRVLLAAVASHQGRIDDATTQLERALEECDDTFAVELLLVDLLVRNARTARARSLAQETVNRHPDLAVPRVRLAELQIVADQTTEAAQTFRTALQDLAGAEQLETARAYTKFLLDQEQRPAAIELLRSMTEQHPGSVDAHLSLLKMPELRADASEAQRLIDHIRSIEGEAGVRWKISQAAFWLESGQWRTRERETRELLEECVLADPTWEEPALALGTLHQALGELREAEKTYRLALAHKRNAFGVADRLVGLLKQEGRYVEAQEVLDAMPQTSAALSAHRIDLAIGRGEYDRAIQDLELYVATHDQDVAARIRLARLTYVVKRDRDGAMKLLDDAANLSPDSVDVLFAKVSVLQAEGLRDDAIALLNREVTRLDNFPIYWLRATYFNAVGEHDLAEKDYLHLTTFEDAAPAAYGLLGNFYYKRGRTNEAVAIWEQGLERDPENVTLRRALTKGLVASPDPAQRARGRTMLAELRDRLSDDPELLHVEASLLFEERNAQARAQATQRLERAVTLNPAFVASHMILIRLAREDGDLPRARRLVSRALAANPTNAGLKTAQIAVELDFSNVGVARELARGLLDDRRGDLGVTNQMADVFRRAGQNDDAEAFNDEALRIAPEDPFANVSRAALLVARGQQDQATAHLEEYVETDTGRRNVAALLALAAQKTEQADFISADQVLRRAQELAPDAIGVTLQRLRWFGAQARFDDIMSLLSNTPADSREHLPILMTGANLLALAGRDQYLKETRDAFHRIRNLDEANVAAHFGYAEASFQLGNEDDGIDALRHVLRIDPQNRAAINNLAWMLATKKGTAGLTEAEELIRRGIDLYPDDLHLLDTAGVVFLKLNRLDDAREALENCLALATTKNATRAKALMHLAEVLIRLRSDTASIRAHLNEAEQIDRVHQVLSSQERTELSRLLNSI